MTQVNGAKLCMAQKIVIGEFGLQKCLDRPKTFVKRVVNTYKLLTLSCEYLSEVIRQETEQAVTEMEQRSKGEEPATASSSSSSGKQRSDDNDYKAEMAMDRRLEELAEKGEYLEVI